MEVERGLAMKKLLGSVVTAAAAASILGAGCSKTTGMPSVSFTAPVASQPANGTSYKFKAQPVTITINNAVKTAPVTTTYAVEVATDTAFTSKAFTKDGIPESNGPTTSVTL